MTMGLEVNTDVAAQEIGFADPPDHHTFAAMRTTRSENISRVGASESDRFGRGASSGSWRDSVNVVQQHPQELPRLDERSSPARPPSPDFSHLDGEERERILGVLRKLQAEERKDMR